MPSSNTYQVTQPSGNVVSRTVTTNSNGSMTVSDRPISSGGGIIVTTPSGATVSRTTSTSGNRTIVTDTPTTTFIGSSGSRVTNGSSIMTITTTRTTNPINTNPNNNPNLVGGGAINNTFMLPNTNIPLSDAIKVTSANSNYGGYYIHNEDNNLSPTPLGLFGVTNKQVNEFSISNQKAFKSAEISYSTNVAQPYSNSVNTFVSGFENKLAVSNMPSMFQNAAKNVVEIPLYASQEVVSKPYELPAYFLAGEVLSGASEGAGEIFSGAKSVVQRIPMGNSVVKGINLGFKGGLVASYGVGVAMSDNPRKAIGESIPGIVAFGSGYNDKWFGTKTSWSEMESIQNKYNGALTSDFAGKDLSRDFAGMSVTAREVKGFNAVSLRSGVGGEKFYSQYNIDFGEPKSISASDVGNYDYYGVKGSMSGYTNNKGFVGSKDFNVDISKQAFNDIVASSGQGRSNMYSYNMFSLSNPESNLIVAPESRMVVSQGNFEGKLSSDYSTGLVRRGGYSHPKSLTMAKPLTDFEAKNFVEKGYPTSKPGTSLFDDVKISYNKFVDNVRSSFKVSSTKGGGKVYQIVNVEPKVSESSVHGVVSGGSVLSQVVKPLNSEAQVVKPLMSVQASKSSIYGGSVLSKSAFENTGKFQVQSTSDLLSGSRGKMNGNVNSRVLYDVVNKNSLGNSMSSSKSASRFAFMSKSGVSNMSAVAVIPKTASASSYKSVMSTKTDMQSSTTSGLMSGSLIFPSVDVRSKSSYDFVFPGSEYKVNSSSRNPSFPSLNFGDNSLLKKKVKLKSVRKSYGYEPDVTALVLNQRGKKGSKLSYTTGIAPRFKIKGM